MGFEKDSRNIAPWRKVLYYLGLALIALGFIMFASVVFSIIAGSYLNSVNGTGLMMRGVAGFVMIIVGGILRGVGAGGLAGSGLVLDPQKARKDLHPYSDALGGLAKDAVDGFKRAGGGGGRPAIKVRCRNCKALNDETGSFCSKCGHPL